MFSDRLLKWSKKDGFCRNQTLTETICKCFFNNILSQDQKVSLDQTYSKWIDSKIVGGKFLIQCYIPNQKVVPTDSLPILFILDSDMSFGLAYDVVHYS